MRKSFSSIFVAVAVLCWTGTALAAGDAAGGEDHGIPFLEIGLHAFNLALLLGLLVYLLRDKLKAALLERSQSVKKQFDEAATQRKEAEARLNQLERKVEGFAAELGAMREEAEAAAEKEKAIVMARADRDAAAIKSMAELTIKRETTRAKTELRSEAAAIAVKLASEKVTQDIKAADQKRFSDEFLGAVKNGKEAPNG